MCYSSADSQNCIIVNFVWNHHHLLPLWFILLINMMWWLGLFIFLFVIFCFIRCLGSETVSFHVILEYNIMHWLLLRIPFVESYLYFLNHLVSQSYLYTNMKYVNVMVDCFFNLLSILVFVKRWLNIARDLWLTLNQPCGKYYPWAFWVLGNVFNGLPFSPFPKWWRYGCRSARR
jgi:hypothetical protein